ncbi:unnamed protein product, partial [Meganyctiphanes norvegica]
MEPCMTRKQFRDSPTMGLQDNSLTGDYFAILIMNIKSGVYQIRHIISQHPVYLTMFNISEQFQNDSNGNNLPVRRLTLSSTMVFLNAFCRHMLNVILNTSSTVDTSLDIGTSLHALPLATHLLLNVIVPPVKNTLAGPKGQPDGPTQDSPSAGGIINQLRNAIKYKSWWGDAPGILHQKLNQRRVVAAEVDKSGKYIYYAAQRRDRARSVKMRGKKTWDVPASSYALNTFNPIRNIVENMKINPNPEKKMIALSIGDPTVFGNLVPAETITNAVSESVQSGKYNGYGPSTGFEEARAAVASHVSVPGAEVTAKDVILCSGCSCALDMCITALASPGQNILVPRPGFPLYKTLAEGLAIKTKYYNLLPENNWEVDLAMLEDMIDDETAAIVINNPSNPCGSVFNKGHLKAIIEVASRNKVPIIADEIYDYFVFEGHEYHYMASLTDEVPILSCGGLTKRFLVPGWRMGWIVVYDRNNVLEKQARSGLQSLSQRIIGSNTIIQGALPTILAKTPKSFFEGTIQQIQDNAKMAYNLVSAVPGLHPIMPQGAMYMMVRVEMEKFPEFETDMEFVETMISEESVFCLPGKCFDYPNYVRIVLTVPSVMMQEACGRIADFCRTHHIDSMNGQEVPMVIPNGISNGPARSANCKSTLLVTSMTSFKSLQGISIKASLEAVSMVAAEVEAD